MSRLSVLHPDADIISRMIELNRPPAWESAPAPTVCWHEDRARMANFGPDHVLLVPAADRVLAADAQRAIGALNYYFICSRPGIRATDQCRLTGRTVELQFDVLNDDGSVEVLERSLPAPPDLRSLQAADGGRRVTYTLADGDGSYEAALLAQPLFRREPFEPSFLDLEVRYIGRARGVLAEKCALDRLESHAKYQQVLEEVLGSRYRNRDVWLVLGAGTTMDLTALMRGDDPEPTGDELVSEMSRIRSILSTSRRIDITEALLINHFKPPLNDQHTGDLDLGSKTFKHCYDAGLTGLQLVAATGDWGISMYTAGTERSLWNVKTVCLYG